MADSTAKACVICPLVLMLALAACPSALSGAAPARLNNFVVEFVDESFTNRRGVSTVEFEMDKDGWLYLGLEAGGGAHVRMRAGDEASTALDGPGETMRRIPAGPVILEIAGARAGRITARRVPALAAYFFEEHCTKLPHVDIKHSWSELEKAVGHSANIMISRPADAYKPYAEAWKESGGMWLRRDSLSPLRNQEGLDPALFFAERLEGTVWDGATLDELVNADWRHIERYAEGLSRFSGMAGAEGKKLYWWIYSLGSRGSESAIRFLQTACTETLKSFRVSRENAFHGSGCLYTEAGSEGPQRTRQVGIELEPGVEYTLSAYIKADGIPGTGAACMMLIDGGWQNSYGSLRPSPESTGWNRYEASFTPGPSRDGAYQVIITRPGEGALSIDAVQLERGGKASEFTAGGGNRIKNPSFEEGMYAWMSGTGLAKPLVDAVVDNGHYFLQEMYLLSEETEEKAAERIDRPLELLAEAFEVHGGRLRRHVMIAPLVYNARPGAWAGNFYPGVNYKVFLDMQMQAMASRDGLEDIGGISFWNAHYATPEVLGWFGALLRHYCIEGNVERLSEDPYRLEHISNGGFENGLDGWETAGSVEAVPVHDMPEKGFVEARRQPSLPAGSVVRTSRRGDEPNSFGQAIRRLEPGRLYSVKVYAARPDYSSRPVPAKIDIEGGAVRPEGEHGDEFSEHKWSHVWRVRRSPEEVFWTKHFRVFRAAAEEGYLKISDAEPGEAYWDFVQVEPYFEY